MSGADSVLVKPALAAQFARFRGVVRRHSPGQLLAQVEVAPNALIVLTIEAEKGFRVGQVDLVLDLTALSDAFGVVVRQIHGQGLQLRKSGRETACVFDALTLLLPVFGASADFLVMHKIETLLADFVVTERMSAGNNRLPSPLRTPGARFLRPPSRSAQRRTPSRCCLRIVLR